MSSQACREVSNTLGQPVYNSWLAGALTAAASIAQCQFDHRRDLAPSTAPTKKCTPFFLGEMQLERMHFSLRSRVALNSTDNAFGFLILSFALFVAGLHTYLIDIFRFYNLAYQFVLSSVLYVTVSNNSVVHHCHSKRKIRFAINREHEIF